MREEVTLNREAKAVQIPYGYEVTLPSGSRGTIVQSLGGAYTVITEAGMMVRVSGEEVQALGKEISSGPEIDHDHLTREDLEKLVWDQLRTCYDPEIPVNIVDLGLVYACELKERQDGNFDVDVKMTLTAPGCGMGPVLANDVRTKVIALPKIEDADVQVVWDPVWDRSMMSEAAKLQLGIW